MKNYGEPDKFLDIEQSYFVWHVADRGYYWDHEAKAISPLKIHLEQVAGDTPNRPKPKKSPNAPFLIITPETTGFYQTKPLEDEPTLFLKFADVEPKPEAIVEFANEFGPLTRGWPPLYTPKHSHLKEGSQEQVRKYGIKIDVGDGRIYRGVHGDPLNLWLEELEDMRWTVALWQWLKDGDTSSLAKVIYWPEDGESVGCVLADKDVLLSYPSSEEAFLNAPLSGKKVRVGWLAIKGDDAIFPRFRPGDTYLPAKRLLQKMISEKLIEHRVTPGLLWDAKNELIPYLMPEDFLAAMWLQFFRAVTGERKFKRCAICGKWEDATEKKETWTKHKACANRERIRRYRAKNKHS